MSPGEPVKLSGDAEKRLLEKIDEELSESVLDNATLCEEVAELDRLYRAEPKQRIKSFPWRGAANLVIPTIGITVDAIVARIVNTVFGVEPFWSIRPTGSQPEYLAMAQSVEPYMEWSRKNEYDLYSSVKSNAIETTQLGWGWLKPVWNNSTTREWDVQSRTYQDRICRAPDVCYIPVTDIMRQVGVDDEYDAEWIGQRVQLTDVALAWKGYEKVYENVDDVMDEKDVDLPEYRMNGMLQASEGRPYREKLNTFYELWMDFPLQKKKGVPVSIVVTYHRPLRKIMRVIYNPNMYGIRPFYRTRFIELRGKKGRGFGIADQIKYMQDELSTIHNQQLDNSTIANTRWFLGRKNAVKADTRIWPGRFLTVPDPERDVKAMQLGEVYNSMRALEVSVMSYMERRSGVSDYSLGRESSVLGDRATATGTLAIIQEGNRRFDLNVRDVRETYAKVGRHVFMLNNQYRPKGLSYLVQGEDGQYTEMAFDLPEEMVAHKFGFELTASSATINKQLEQAGLTQLLGILMQNMQAGQQAVMMLANPQIPAEAKEFTMKYMIGLTQLVRRITSTFGEKDTQYLVPDMPAPPPVQPQPPIGPDGMPLGASNGVGQQNGQGGPAGPPIAAGPPVVPGAGGQPPGAEAAGPGGTPGEPTVA
jgi:hypothetical protein